MHRSVAKLYGEPVIELPHDLYIPPDALEVFLEAFEGPLDLLLYLIRKQNLDILDIPMAALTRQYMDYIEMMRSKHLELAAEYLLMAAMLTEIKSRMLLPRPPAPSADEDDPRAELVRRLLEYERMKQAAQDLDELPRPGATDRHLGAGSSAGRGAPAGRRSAGPRRSLAQPAPARAHHPHHHMSREELSVRAHMSSILSALQRAPRRRVRRAVRSAARRAVLVVTFLALPRARARALIEITQSAGFGPIYVKLAHAESA